MSAEFEQYRVESLEAVLRVADSVKGVVTRAETDAYCDVCLNEWKKVYPVNALPTLPHEGCTCLRGYCGCLYVPVKHVSKALLEQSAQASMEPPTVKDILKSRDIMKSDQRSSDSFGIIGKFMFAGRNDTVARANTFSYLRSFGLFTWLEFDDELTDQLVTIELDHVPSIVAELRNTGYFEKMSQGRIELSILQLTERGVLFYIWYPTGDSMIHIPHNRIRCIHVLSGDELQEISMM